MRKYIRKTDRGTTPKDVMRTAVMTVIAEKRSVRSIAIAFNIPHKTLHRYVQKAKAEQNEDQSISLSRVGQIFTKEQELSLVQYIKNASDTNHDLSPKEVRTIAYQYAIANNILVPNGWKEKKMAGPDWMRSFIKRNSSLKTLTQQSTSPSSITSFNRANVTAFFSYLRVVCEQLNLQACDVWNMDEIGITTMHIANRIIPRRNIRQIGRLTSEEKGSLVTLALAVSAAGNSVPPFFLFPGVDFQEDLLSNAPVGSIGDSNQTCWMNEANFIKFAKHFVQHARCSTDKPALLLLENYDSRFCVEALNYFKENGVTVLPFPPHCSHILQPLDCGIFESFKEYINTSCNIFLAKHPGKVLTINDLPGIIKIALPLAVTQNIIKEGFSKTGISPLNENIFADSKSMAGHVIDKPEEDNHSSTPTLTIPSSTVLITSEEVKPQQKEGS